MRWVRSSFRVASVDINNPNPMEYKMGMILAELHYSWGIFSRLSETQFLNKVIYAEFFIELKYGSAMIW